MIDHFLARFFDVADWSVSEQLGEVVSPLVSCWLRRTSGSSKFVNIFLIISFFRGFWVVRCGYSDHTLGYGRNRRNVGKTNDDRVIREK